MITFSSESDKLLAYRYLPTEETNLIIGINTASNDKKENTVINYNSEDYILKPLNFNKKWYKNDSIMKKTSGLRIMSNLNKTTGFSNTINPITSNYKYKSVLSIYSGNGGDMGKFYLNNISWVVAIDRDNDANEEFKRRKEEYDRNKSRTFKWTSIKASLEQKNFIKIINKNVGINQTFDVIDIQLGLHFSLNPETEDHIMNIFNTFSNKNKIKTKLLISINGKDNIL